MVQKILIKKKTEPEIGFPIGVIMKKKDTPGDVGIEIEVEGRRLPMPSNSSLGNIISSFWEYHKDHSLRGAENGEYVLRHPVKFSEVDAALDQLWEKFEAMKSTIDDSNRTSVHVHLNVQKFHLNRLASFVALYTIVEEVLTEWCGEHRVGNLFCLRAKDAPATISYIKRFIRQDGQGNLPDILHYSALNVNALAKFGSVELRTLRGVNDKQTIRTWIGMLKRLYDLSAEYEDPRDIAALFSSDGPLHFFDMIMGSYAHEIKKTIGWPDDDIRDSMYEGIRMAQDICYCRDWSVFKPMNVKDDPFGRDLRKVTHKIATTGAELFGWGGPEPEPPAIPDSLSQWTIDGTFNPYVESEPDYPHPNEDDDEEED